MKKLENIPRKQIFEVPEGYFDRLPAKIQTRLERPVEQPGFVIRYRLQYALPALALVVAAILWFTPTRSRQDVESMLASVQTDQLVAFLNESDLTMDELVEHADFDEAEIQQIEAEAYGLGIDDGELGTYVDELDLDNI